MRTMIYRCPICGNVVMKLVDSGIVPHCCGEEMRLQTAQSTGDLPHLSDHHSPRVDLRDPSTLHVQVGSELHPMTPEHRICFVLLESEQGVQIHYPRVGGHPTSSFYCGHDKPVAVYEYCNLHGLWATHYLPPTIRYQSCPRKE